MSNLFKGFRNLFVLNSQKGGKQGITATDLVIKHIKSLTLSSSAGSIDLRGYVPKGTTVSYVMLKQGTTDATTGELAVAAAVPGAAVTVDVLVVYNGSEHDRA
jgi:hypothetical protein